MRVLGVPVIHHYVQFRFYFCFKLVMPAVKAILKSRHPKFVDPYLGKLTLWSVSVIAKTLQWKISKGSKTT